MRSWRLKLDLTSVIILIAVGVLLPVLLSTSVGIVAIVVIGRPGGLVTGVLVICFAAAAGGSALIAVVLTARKARLARLQADFIANVTHELRTPLSSIRLHTQTLQSGLLADDPATVSACLATIARETEWLDSMLDKVLTWRASAGDMLPLELVEAPVTRAVDEAVARFRAMVLPEEIELTLETTARCAVRHDSKAISAVVINLLTNAYKNTGVQKTIWLTTHDVPGGVVITVRDNGIGIRPEDAERIFEPFYRVKSNGGGASGVGLGLSLARHIIARHGGDISAAPAEPSGSVVTIRLPAAGRMP